ncbi:MAG: lipid-A-disaccharide synthase [Planctomycetota bacterium]
MAHRLELARVVGRELLRAVGLPFNLALFLLTKARHRRAAELAIANSATQAGPRPDDAPRPGRLPDPLFLSCGEASGEELAMRLLDAIEERPRILAFGGERLRARGIDVRFPLAEHAVMGLAGVFASIPLLVRAFRTYLEILDRERPRAVCLIDYPGLHLVMAEAARRRGIRTIHYVAPQYWAWGPWRMRRYRRAFDEVLTILPFEPSFFDRAGLRSTYVGHPLLDAPPASATFAHDGGPLLLLLPGSRKKEVRLHLLPMIAVARSLRAEFPNLRVVIAHRDGRRLALARELLAAEPDHDFLELREIEPRAVLPHATAALVKSGTGSLETCIAKVPCVVVYVVAGIIARFARRHLLTVPHFASANLCMGRAIVPEIGIESARDWDRARDHLRELLQDSAARRTMLADLQALGGRLGSPGASQRVAAALCREPVRPNEPLS